MLTKYYKNKNQSKYLASNGTVCSIYSHPQKPTFPQILRNPNLLNIY